jgi:hypothetical protein
MPDVTVYITIGNSDDKLSQVDWSRFTADIRVAIANWNGRIWFAGFAPPDSRFQNACFGASFDHDHIGGLRMSLKQIREAYRQDSIAFAVVDHVELI